MERPLPFGALARSVEADGLEWRRSSPTLIVEPKDPLEQMSAFSE